MKSFNFEHNEGSEIIIANNAKEAVIHYFTKYLDDVMLDDILSATEEGIKTTEIEGKDLTEERHIFDEVVNEYIYVSYQDIIDGFSGAVPDVVLCPSY